MFGDIARFLLNTVFTLFGAALLLRAWLQVVRMPPYNPVTNAVLPLKFSTSLSPSRLYGAVAFLKDNAEVGRDAQTGAAAGVRTPCAGAAPRRACLRRDSRVRRRPERRGRGASL